MSAAPAPPQTSHASSSGRPPVPIAGPPAGPAARTQPGRPRRWPRAVAPFLVLLILYVGTGWAHLAEEPDRRDPGTLSPTGTGPDGSSRLAALLAAQGVTIKRVTTPADALAAAGHDRDATVFVPSPDLLQPAFLPLLVVQRGHRRVVLVEPGALTTAMSGLPITPVGTRWAAAVTTPECATPYAMRAGRAAVRRTSYLLGGAAPAATVDCYQGGLVGTRLNGSEVIVAGATDPFRNSRIDEVGNASLATDLLSASPTMIWVDVHVSTPVTRTQVDGPSYHRPTIDRSNGSNPLWGALPPAFWAALLLAGAIAVLLALVHGRRLGPPVAEPLPVIVPATETVTGRGRLYQRTRARERAFRALRDAALVRMITALPPAGATATGAAADPGAPDPDTAVTAVATHTGLAPATVRQTLYPTAPATDDELVAAVAALDGLVHAVLRK